MTSTVFWTVATVMVVLTAVAIVGPLYWSRRAAAEQFTARRALSAAAIACGVPLAALALYSWFGAPQLLLGQSASAAAAVSAPHPTSNGDAAGAAGDMNAAIAGLETKLAQNPSDSAGWELLAQSYEFVGRAADAEMARARAAGKTPSADAALLNALRKNTASNSSAPPGDAEAAEQARRARDFGAATALYAKAAAGGKLTADQWADYADAVGAQRGRLNPDSEPMIRAALKLEPNHLKALWLLGSLQTERADRKAALQTWRKLAALIPSTSPDAKIIAANIAEASGAAPSALPPPLMPTAMPNTAAPNSSTSLRGQVQLDAKLRGQVPSGTTLFVFAKSVEQPGPPLAVMRTTASSWPVAFQLDDSMAMMPNRKLSDFERITVEARLSPSGSVDAGAGGWRGATAALDRLTSTAPITVVIREQVR